MPKSQQAQHSFSGGVLSPRMALRGDLPDYGDSLKVAENFFLTPQGGAVFRQGFQRATPVETANTENRTFRFRRGGDKSDLLVVVGEQAIVILKERPGDRILETQQAFYNYFGGPSPELYFSNTERVGILVQKGQPPYYIEVSEQEEYRGFHLPFLRVPRVIYYDDKSPQNAGSNATYRVTMPVGGEGAWFAGMRFVVVYGGDISNEGFELPKEYWPAWSTTDGGGLTAAERNAEAIRQGTKFTVHLMSDLSQVTVTPLGLGEYLVFIEGPGAGKTLEVRPVQTTGVEPAVVVPEPGSELTEGDEPAWSFPNVVVYDGNYYECLKPHYAKQGEIVPGEDGGEYWELLDSEPQYFEYQYGDDGNDWVDEQAYGPWGRGWPQVCSVYQQRAIMGTLDEQPTSVWGSRIGSYEDFQPGVNASDPFFFDLDTSDSPKIKWMQATQASLILGTSAGDFQLGAEISLGPADIQLRKQNSARSFKTAAVSVHNTAFYIEQGRTKIRATSYGRTRNAWTSDDVSVAAEHLFQQKCKRILLMQAPEEMFLVLREDGNCVVMHRRDTENGMAIAWTELLTAEEHFIEDINTYYSVNTEEDCVVASVIDPVSEERSFQRLEYPRRVIDPDQTLSEQGIVYLDGWIRVNVRSDNVIDVAPLRGVVTVLADDAFIGNYEVIDGLIQINEDVSGKDVVVGYDYKGRLQPFERVAGNPNGVGYGTKRRWNRLYVRTLDSAEVKVNGYLSPERDPSKPMGEPDIIKPGVRDWLHVGKFGDDGSYEILQDKPYPTHILGVFGTIQVEDG